MTVTNNDDTRLACAREALTQYMLEKRCRKTPERYALLEAAYTIGEQFTVDTLQKFVEKKLPLSRVTVYNNLELFVKAGLVVKHPTPGLVKYEICYAKKTHHKLLCTVCGSTTEFFDDAISDFLMQKRFKKFHSTNCSVTIFGICSRCQAKINRERKKLNKQNKKTK
ncbi:MAG: transcriptional repressor [Bacteroidaceae bacterium]|nr:transcriptional repressor [Bacteroidaceae bacterium]